MSGSDVDALSEDTIEGIRGVLRETPVSFALLFGSGARDAMERGRDIDIAFEFADLRPDDAGYADEYLALLSALDEVTPKNVDAVDVHNMTPRFAHVVFTEGQLLVGSERRRDELQEALANDPPSVSDARERVAKAAERLVEGT